MYGLIRIVIIAVLAVGFFALANLLNFRFQKKEIYILFASLGILLLIIFIIPIENAFYTFETPEKAYKHLSFENTEIEILVKGDNCDYVVGKTSNNDEYVTTVIPKTDSGWKVRNSFAVKERNIELPHLNYCVITMIQYEDDRFVEIMFLTPGPHEVTSSDDGIFEKQSFSLEDEGELYKYYTHISDVENYKLFIDGIKIDVLN